MTNILEKKYANAIANPLATAAGQLRKNIWRVATIINEIPKIVLINR
jgi:hypothetical protein